ncbi:Dolichyl-phosphate-mannose-protein mannosyltransferase, putative [Trichomonas vaginalis G3]|uniref:Dolichyl-phosphate-mannose-protein mannosyltransferase, putative n=1 Tax=Trichomonas vaginalis (strain ATCC PRA-98 / G3) TaxID=412133 RepID=A2D7V5_TRIV3|nr:dolichyl-phosphate-mannose-protein mannosyltransferase protein [Trichomonas vaginalis G3]EAY23388.1 Dolichyl-phosphate-mannose-protein mannosyltransferase, putative [Trichomonas vaginalis G3]KAI5493802.1 dolichyl-phosphate-mannose-protein mannosyltransferase protein [Trichomonas vaginalis G3]|eukprot:XP_001584374.1 Dolichyl-phosphate-mannose-protein mannosyltransferase [Trichomonas vaginalis G3]
MKKYGLTSMDCFLMTIIAFISLGVRLYRLGHPSRVTFDEVYFGNFSNAYINRSYYSDIHPPLGKITMALVAWATGYPGNINFGRSSNYRDEETNYVSLRITPNIFGSFCSVLIYIALRNLNIKYFAAFTGALMVALEQSSIVEHKFILSDAMLHFFSCLHICAFTYFIKHQDFISTFIAGITLGLAISCKLTALGLIALDGITQIIWIFTEWPNIIKIINRASTLLGPAITVFFFSYVIHHDILMFRDHTNTYHEDHFRQYLLLRNDLNKTYKANRIIGRSHILTIVKDLFNTHKNNMRITTPHPWSSMPINWPLLLDRYVLFWVGEGTSIKCLGLPAVIWSTTFFIFLTPFFGIFRIADYSVLYTFLGWLFSYLPFVLVPRGMFMYHYIVPMMFGAMNLASLANCIFRKWPHYRTYFFATICILVSANFLLFSPIIYGNPLLKSTDNYLIWRNEWLWGPQEPVQYFGEEMFNTTIQYGSLRRKFF